MKIKNNTQNPITRCGMEIQPGAYYTIEKTELSKWQSSSQVIDDIVNNVLIINDDISDITDHAQAVALLMEVDPTPRDSQGRPYFVRPPFTDKAVSNGKLFRRVHGVTAVIVANGDTVVELVVPYNQAKINQVQVVWVPEGLTCDFEVYDSPTASMQAAAGVPEQYRVPNAKLNQFGFNVGIASDEYFDESSYDADLLKDMKLKATIHNPTSVTKTICVNFVLHEIKP